jgi:2'-5' RNA ligase
MRVTLRIGAMAPHAEPAVMGDVPAAIEGKTMSTQGSLPGLVPDRPTDRLFLALFPDGEHAARLASLAGACLARHRMGTGAVEARRLHVTLFHLGDYAGLPPGLADDAARALSRVEADPFAVRFDRVGSFGNRSAKSPLVLAANDGNEALHALHRQLAGHLRACGLDRWTRGAFVPHMTVAYGRATVPFEPIEPVTWPAREVLLVHSLLGRTRHVRLASRALASR